MTSSTEPRRDSNIHEYQTSGCCIFFRRFSIDIDRGLVDLVIRRRQLMLSQFHRVGHGGENEHLLALQEHVDRVEPRPNASGVISARMTSRNPWQAAQGAMLSGPRVVEHIILAAFRDAFSLRQPCVPI